ncbi:hypothetical protein J5J10_18815 [Ciceribacter sp. L1K23]|uniref:hypothetical protein n=1 Tax=unclassified Ciceribacter TaxID=2628820 RepID=UPI001ABDCC2A|nr:MULTISPECIES: hypothetical protein [unclassified Ciceribacter]MBO3758178.1 hypothetical protein [Ciceribacter sp. L1K22]MBR0557744.1 hypothetical protein [Ciceribacter sp. L1K23]
MNNLRSIALAAGGIVILALAAAFTLSLTLVLGAVLTAVIGIRMLALRFREARVPVRAKSGKTDMRVWNDGRGTIIDL